MAECPHSDFESLVTVEFVEPSTLAPYYRARLQVRCTQCQGPLIFGGLPPLNPTLFYTVAVGAGGSEVYLSGTVTSPIPPQEGQAWTRVQVPEAAAPPSPPPA